MDNRKKYVLSICKDEDKILLIEKIKPAWCAGKINFLGGSIEPDELPEQAAVRELKEESGLDSVEPKIIGTIESSDALVYCVCLKLVDPKLPLNPDPSEVEEVFWMDTSDALKDKRLIANLKVIIPMVEYEVYNWKIFHRKDSDSEFDFTFTESLN